MNSDPFENWLQKETEKIREVKIPAPLLETLPKKVAGRVREVQKKFYLQMFCLGLALLLGAVAVTVILKREQAPVSSLIPPVNQVVSESKAREGAPGVSAVSAEDLVSALANLEEERLWQLGPEIYSVNLEAMDWVPLAR